MASRDSDQVATHAAPWEDNAAAKLEAIFRRKHADVIVAEAQGHPRMSERAFAA